MNFSSKLRIHHIKPLRPIKYDQANIFLPLNSDGPILRLSSPIPICLLFEATSGYLMQLNPNLRQMLPIYSWGFINIASWLELTTDQSCHIIDIYDMKV